MKTLPKGTPVRVIMPPLEGEVLESMTNGDAFGYRVAFKGADGDMHERFFTVDQVEEVT